MFKLMAVEVSLSNIPALGTADNTLLLRKRRYWNSCITYKISILGLRTSSGIRGRNSVGITDNMEPNVNKIQ